MDAIECMRSRRSIRNFKNEPITRSDIEAIIDCARLAPTAMNSQPWEFIAVTDKKVLSEISSNCTYGLFIQNAACCIIVCGDKNNNHLLEDGSAATENILLAARSKGLGSCWVAGWERDYNPKIKKIVGIPDKFDLVSIIPIGVPMDNPKPSNKRELKDVLHWEKF